MNIKKVEYIKPHMSRAYIGQPQQPKPVSKGTIVEKVNEIAYTLNHLIDWIEKNGNKAPEREAEIENQLKSLTETVNNIASDLSDKTGDKKGE